MFYTVCDVCNSKVDEKSEQPYVTSKLCNSCIEIETTVGLTRCNCGEFASEMGMYCITCFEDLD